MFKYDQEFFAEHFDASMDFFINKFFLRFFLIALACRVGLGISIIYLFNPDQYEFFYVLSLISVFIATCITFSWIKDLKFKEKKGIKETSIIFVANSLSELSRRALIVRVSSAYFWRFCVTNIVVYCLSYPLITMFNINWSFLPLITGFLSLYAAWLWFTLLNDKTGSYIDFSSRVID
jgi:hypothetical protein